MKYSAFLLNCLLYSLPLRQKGHVCDWLTEWVTHWKRVEHFSHSTAMDNTITPIDWWDLGNDPPDESTLGTEKPDLERLVDGVAEDQVAAPQDAAANRPKQDRQRWEKKISCKPIIFSPPHYVPYFRVMDPDRFWLFGQLFNQLSRIFITMGMGMSIS